MQDPSSAYYQAMMKPPHPPQFQEHEQLKCPRCDSINTKFCYYNNYNLAQPRYFCKSCRRYWTKGGALRNIPVGGGSRKNTKRTSAASKRQGGIKPPDPNPNQLVQSSSGPGHDSIRVFESSLDQERKVLDMSGSFSSLLASNMQLLGGTNTVGSDMKPVQGAQLGPFQGLSSGAGQDMRRSGGGTDGGDGGEGSYSWGGGSNGWPDLAIYTPSSSFQ